MDSRSLLAVAVTILPWASAFAGIRAGLEHYSPGHLTLLRFLVASLVLGIWALVTRMPLPQWKDWPAIFILGFLGISVYHTALNFGEVTVASGPAALLIACGPIFVAMLAQGVYRERLSLLGWLGIGVAFCGVALIAIGNNKEGLRFEPGALLILLSALVTAIYFVFQRRLVQKYSPLQFTAYSIWAGTIPLFIFFPGFIQNVVSAPAAPTLSVCYLGIFPGALAYVTWSYALSRSPASKVSSYLYLSPVLAFAIAFFWLGEVPTILAILGGILAMAGVALVHSLGSVSKPSSPAK